MLKTSYNSFILFQHKHLLYCSKYHWRVRQLQVAGHNPIEIHTRRQRAPVELDLLDALEHMLSIYQRRDLLSKNIVDGQRYERFGGEVELDRRRGIERIGI